MSTISIPFTFSSGAVIVASQHNSCFSVIYSDYNGGITNVNIDPSAAIAYSKLNITGSIVNNDINASAAIVDSKLAQITTASKVSGAAITSLPSVPSGAGVLPIANLATGTPTGAKFIRDDGTLQVAGYYVLVSNTAVSAANNSGDILITATNYYKVILHLGNLSAADIISIRVNNTGGSSYEWALNGRTTGGALTGGGTGASEIQISTAVTNSSTSYLQAEFLITPADSSILLFGGKSVFKENSGGLRAFTDFMGYSPISTPVSFRILTASGSTMSGNILLYQLLTS